LFGPIGGTEAVSAVSIVGGLVVGAAGGFLAILASIVIHPISLFGSLVGGAILSTAIVVGIACFERSGLRWRGYRRLSRDEVRRVAPLVKDSADATDLPALPRFAMQDSVIPNAWTHMRTVVLTTGLLQIMTDGELRAVLTHELHHWRMGDAVGLHFIWAASLPAALTYNLGTVLSGSRPTASGQKSHSTTAALLALLGWLILWPSWVITKCLIAPLTASSQRRYEYQADAAALTIGFGSDMQSALRKMGAFESGRTGWEQAMTATHPPTELRIEALEPRRADDWQYQEYELRGPSWKEIEQILHLRRRRASAAAAWTTMTGRRT
jgi:Zn-dependent protease with chaperone function